MHWLIAVRRQRIQLECPLNLVFIDTNVPQMFCLSPKTIDASDVFLLNQLPFHITFGLLAS
jgi:hypothetical protein